MTMLVSSEVHGVIRARELIGMEVVEKVDTVMKVPRAEKIRQVSSKRHVDISYDDCHSV